MFGKHFTSMYTGSLFGKPALVFAVWGWAFSHMRPSRKDGECYVEINPTLLAATFAATVEEVQKALEILETPDPASRTSAEDGRRLILLGESRHAGPMQYRVVNGTHYRAIRDEQDRREYLTKAKRKERARKRADVNNVNHGQPPSTQAEVEAEAEVEVEVEATGGASETSSAAARSRKRPKLIYGDDCEPMQLAVLLRDLLTATGPLTRQPDLQKEAREFDLLSRERQIDTLTIRGAIEHAVSHKRKFFLSAGAFRAFWKDGSSKFDTLLAEMASSPKSNRKGESSGDVFTQHFGNM